MVLLLFLYRASWLDKRERPFDFHGNAKSALTFSCFALDQIFKFEKLEPAMAVKLSNAIDVHIGGRIRLARMELSMSQETLGARLGVTFQQVQKYEKGANRVAGSRFWTLSQILGVPPSYFFEGLDDPALDDPTTAEALKARTLFVTTPEGSKLVSRFQAVESDAIRHAVLDLLKTLGSGTIAETEG